MSPAFLIKQLIFQVDHLDEFTMLRETHSKWEKVVEE